MTRLEMLAVVGDLQFRDWWFDLQANSGTDLFLRVTFMAPCSTTGEMAQQKGRKWRLSEHMTKSEVVTTALKAVLAAVEHEAREDFLYRDVAIFGPHVDVEALYVVARQTDARPALA